jgi:hypothetical protein
MRVKGNLKNRKEKGDMGDKVEIEYPQVRKKVRFPFGLVTTADVTIIVLYTEVP